ncbi:MAG: NADP-dependent malic enzyme [candidate division NC10 bacterium]|nr:NADP-dependent malic enzyme [candidate division NC10 bacterium]
MRKGWLLEEALELRRRHQGVIGVESKILVRDRSVLSLVYTPGVAAPCLEIAKDPALSYVYTCRGNTVGIVTDGSAVYQQGTVGPEAALPVMEGKAILLKTFAGVNGIPVCLKDQDLEGMVKTISLLTPTFGAFCLEDMASPLCFALEDRLRGVLGLPLFLNHAHGAGVVVLAGLQNALKLVGKSLPEVSIVLAGAGAAGIGTARLLLKAGAKRLVLADRAGALFDGRLQRMNDVKAEIARLTNVEGRRGTLADLLQGADVFIGLSAGELVTADMIRTMAKDPIIFALAVPNPEILPEEIEATGVKVIATSLTNGPNQLDIVLAFPGILRGLLDVQATMVTEGMLLSAAAALAGLVPDEGLRPDMIIPQALDLRVAPTLAAAVAKAAFLEGVAGRKVDPEEVAERLFRYLYQGPSSLVPPCAKKPASMEEEAIDLHRRYQGKLEVKPKLPIRDQKLLGLLYLPPGIARPVQEIMADPERVFDLTVKGNLVAVVSDGTAVLGLGDIGPLGAMPVMEGKAVLFKTFGGVEAFPICVGTKDPNEIVEVVKAISPVFGGINLEDISAPRCFVIEERLKRELDIPIFHDDQHGTAVVTLGGLVNALKLTGRRFEDVKVVINGAGASGVAVAKILLSMGVQDLILCDTKGVIYQGRKEGMNPAKEEMAKITNPRMVKGSLAEALKGANVFIGLSVAGAVTKEMVRSMAKDPIIFAMANPIPEIYPDEAKAAGAAIVATGRSDFPNQINNSLGFPGIFRGALDVRAREINQEMKVAAGLAIASLVSDRELSPGYIIPEMMDFREPVAVAVAVAKAAVETGVARRPLTPEEVEARARRIIYEGLPC